MLEQSADVNLVKIRLAIHVDAHAREHDYEIEPQTQQVSVFNPQHRAIELQWIAFKSPVSHSSRFIDDVPVAQ